nr:hypothetical protein [Streptomyces sp. WAC07061]
MGVAVARQQAQHLGGVVQFRPAARVLRFRQGPAAGGTEHAEVLAQPHVVDGHGAGRRHHGQGLRTDDLALQPRFEHRVGRSARPAREDVLGEPLDAGTGGVGGVRQDAAGGVRRAGDEGHHHAGGPREDGPLGRRGRHAPGVSLRSAQLIHRSSVGPAGGVPRACRIRRGGERAGASRVEVKSGPPPRRPPMTERTASGET